MNRLNVAFMEHNVVGSVVHVIAPLEFKDHLRATTFVTAQHLGEGAGLEETKERLVKAM